MRRPRLDYESHATGLDRNEVGAMLVAAGLAGARDHALVSLLALNGLRVSEAIGADIEDLGLARGHRTLTILRKGGKVVTIPLAPGRPGPSISRSANAATGRSSSDSTVGGSIATRLVVSCAASPDARASPSAWGPTPCATRSSAPRSTPGCRSATCKKPPATPTPAPPCATTGARVSLDRHATYIVATFLAAPAADTIEWRPNELWCWDASHFSACAAAPIVYGIIDIVSRKWIATLLCAEATSVQVKVVFLAGLEADGLLADLEWRLDETVSRHSGWVGEADERSQYGDYPRPDRTSCRGLPRAQSSPDR